MKSNSTTNFLLGIIAAEVVFLTVRAFADRWNEEPPYLRGPHRPVPPSDAEVSFEASNSEQFEDRQLKGSMQGVAEKLKDPAWAGLLEANAGNISLTDAERAVPMPKSAQFVERLDRNQFIGQGMKDRSRK